MNAPKGPETLSVIFLFPKMQTGDRQGNSVFINTDFEWMNFEIFGYGNTTFRGIWLMCYRFYVCVYINCRSTIKIWCQSVLPMQAEYCLGQKIHSEEIIYTIRGVGASSLLMPFGWLWYKVINSAMNDSFFVVTNSRIVMGCWAAPWELICSFEGSFCAIRFDLVVSHY